jgi:hypothetical protein
MQDTYRPNEDGPLKVTDRYDEDIRRERMNERRDRDRDGHRDRDRERGRDRRDVVRDDKPILYPIGVSCLSGTDD